MSLIASNGPRLLGILGFEPGQLLIMGVVAVLLFGRRLPEVARSFGRQVMELRKGLQGLQQELTSAINLSTPSERFEQHVDDHVAATAPKFEPPPAEPADPAQSAAPAEQPAATTPSPSG